MNEYHKIQTVWLRDPATKHKTLLEGQWATPEFEYLRDNTWVFTEKVDGTNIRVMWDGERVTFGGKTDRAQLPAKLVTRLEERFPAALLASTFDGPACLYGEGYGPGIQKGGGNYRADQDFVLFDVLVGAWWLQQRDVSEVAANLEIDAVPIVGKGTLSEMIEVVQARRPSNWGDFPAEGIVARPMVELVARNGHRIITKLKAKDFAEARQ